MGRSASELKAKRSTPYICLSALSGRRFHWICYQPQFRRKETLVPLLFNLKENRVISCNQCKYWCPMIQVVIVYLEIATCLALLPLIFDWLRVKTFGVRIRLEQEVLNYLHPFFFMCHLFCELQISTLFFPYVTCLQSSGGCNQCF